ncbi:MAG: HAD family hydrolase [Thermomicrobiales bacterium]
MTLPIKAVVFDLGETLVDETRMWSSVAQYAGIPEFTVYATLGGMIERRESHRSIFGLMQIESVDPNVLGYQIELRDLYPDVEPTLRQLKAGGFRLGVTGNQPEGAAEQTASLGLPFDFVGSSSRWGVSKPSAAFFERIVTELELEPEEIVYVGDRLDNDVFPARDAGLHSIFIRRGPWGYLQSLWPEADDAPYTIRSLNEVPKLISRINEERVAKESKT